MLKIPMIGIEYNWFPPLEQKTYDICLALNNPPFMLGFVITVMEEMLSFIKPTDSAVNVYQLSQENPSNFSRRH